MGNFDEFRFLRACVSPNSSRFARVTVILEKRTINVRQVVGSSTGGADGTRTHGNSNEINKLLMQKCRRDQIPSKPVMSPNLPPDLPPTIAHHRGSSVSSNAGKRPIHIFKKIVHVLKSDSEPDVWNAPPGVHILPGIDGNGSAAGRGSNKESMWTISDKSLRSTISSAATGS